MPYNIIKRWTFVTVEEQLAFRSKEDKGIFKGAFAGLVWIGKDTFIKAKPGGGAPRYLGGYIRSLSKISNTPNALISCQKSTLIKKNTPSLIKTLTLDEREHAFDAIILCLFSGSRLESPVTSGVTRRQSRIYSWIVRGFSPPYFVPGYKKVPFFYKIAELRRSLKRSFLPRNT